MKRMTLTPQEETMTADEVAKALAVLKADIAKDEAALNGKKAKADLLGKRLVGLKEKELNLLYHELRIHPPTASAPDQPEGQASKPKLAEITVSDEEGQKLAAAIMKVITGEALTCDGIKAKLKDAHPEIEDQPISKLLKKYYPNGYTFHGHGRGTEYKASGVKQGAHWSAPL